MSPLETLLDEPHKLPLRPFAKLCASGILDQPPSSGTTGKEDLRATCWLLLLGVIDASQPKDTYQPQLESSREKYYALVEALSQGLDSFSAANNNNNNKSQRQDKALLESAQDVQRTGCGLSFFSSTVPPAENALSGSPVARRCFTRLHLLRPAPSLRRPMPVNNNRSSVTTSFSSPSTTTTNNESRSSSPAGGYGNGNTSTGLSTPSVESEPDSRADQLHRLLFCWALCNPAGYVQGMSSLASVFLFVFASRSSELGRKHAEADAFHAFSHLLGQQSSGLGELFSVAEQDGFEMGQAGSGLGAVLARLGERIELCDVQLSLHLKQQGVQPSFFAIKWLTTLFAQQFDMSTLLPIWDWLLAQLHAQSPPLEAQSRLSPFIEALVDLCTTFVLSLSDRLLQADFGLCLGFLQSVECHIPSAVLAAASSMQEKRLTAPLTAANSSPSTTTPSKLSLKERLRAAADGAAKQYSAFQQTDTAASISKSATNWGIAAMSLRGSVSAPDPADLSKRFQTLGSSLGSSVRVRPAASPTQDQPFRPPDATDPPYPPPSSDAKTNTTPPMQSTSYFGSEPAAGPSSSSTPKHKPLLLGSASRRLSNSSLSASVPASASSKSPLLSPSPKQQSNLNRLSQSSSGGHLSYLHGRSSSSSTHHAFSRTLLDEVADAQAAGASASPEVSRRRRQASEPISPLPHQRRWAAHESPLATSSKGAKQLPSLPNTSEAHDRGQSGSGSGSSPRGHAKRYSIPTRPQRSSSLADSFSPTPVDVGGSPKAQKGKEDALGLGISADQGEGAAPVLNPAPKRRGRLSSSRRKMSDSVSSSSHSAAGGGGDGDGKEDGQEVLLPPIPDEGLTKEGESPAGYDGILDSYQ